MPDSNTIALVSVVGATATAIAVPLINGAFAARADRRKFEHERHEKDLDERRALLDDCAHALTTYIEATRDLLGRYVFSHPANAEARDLDFYMAAIDANIAAKAHAYALNRRLVIRLGRHSDVVVAYGNVLKLLDEATTDIATRITERTANKPDRRDDLVVAQDSMNASWYEAHERYLDAATKSVGSK
ncbi:MAG TPA: hypothetical protein VFG42_08200 [Baekduia sp.]|uniref:hypothetical protein n=1 Tax=Baekduia sp. TaxID=2600305 RepID=UPI002D7960D0|nr:hypothetical protein [Baekduia sp.]HET6506756.1 hypothetical protein [Baekduia sp.]